MDVVAFHAATALDARALRADFPIFERGPQGAELAYLDSSNSSQKPRAVLDAMREFYETSYSNVHRGVYELGERAAAGYEGAREALRAGFEDRGLDEILAFIHPDNHRSAAVADRLGMVHRNRVRHPNRPHDVDIYVSRPD
jgi:hypothetical protein